ncbi:hypothetical protein ABPG77_005804 [Micractinium sp. CCAP 211/92]
MPSSFSNGRLSARPACLGSGGRSLVGSGLQLLGLTGLRDGMLYVPSTYRPGVQAPLIVTLHGAGSNAQGGLSHLIAHADAYGTLLLAPESRASTWDMLRGGLGPDVEYINRALEKIFRQFDVDPQRLCISGFSDGASYALTLGVANGGLFSHIAAFSPGFMRPPSYEGKPLVYVSHGVHDRVLRIDYCSRALVPRLEALGYPVTYREFDGPHSVPSSVAKEALTWFCGSRRLSASTRHEE